MNNVALKFFRGFPQVSTCEQVVIQELFEALDDGLVWAEVISDSSNENLNKTQREILKQYVAMNKKFANDLMLSTGNSKEIERRLHGAESFLRSVGAVETTTD